MFLGGDVEVVSGFIEQEQVGGLKHEVGDGDACAFATGKLSYRHVEDIGGKEKALAPAVDVNGLSAEVYEVAVG